MQLSKIDRSGDDNMTLSYSVIPLKGSQSFPLAPPV